VTNRVGVYIHLRRSSADCPEELCRDSMNSVSFTTRFLSHASHFLLTLWRRTVYYGSRAPDGARCRDIPGGG